MPLWKKNFSYIILSKKHSLQERKNINKTLTNSLINPNIQKDSKEVSCFALLSGSLTAEAALVLPLFLFAMVNILSLFLMFESYGTHLAGLHQSGRQLAVLAYAQGDKTQNTDIELVSEEYIKPLIGIMGYQGCLVVNGCVMHKWIGYDLTGEAAVGQEEEEMVFITAHGSVYHISRNCVYLNPTVESVPVSQAVSLKNISGKTYTACQSCGGKGLWVYITEDGERYHSSIGCSGLKRTVDCVTKKYAEKMGRHGCSKCSG